ncbi:MAG: pirin family protein [Verrucomicrobia subdivision 3 bacterium]|nr:pirin family protein [Limisphaerales bacterium]
MKETTKIEEMGRRTGSGLKKLVRVHKSSAKHWVGDGFHVRSVFGYNDLGRELSPFLLLDYAAPTEFPPGSQRRGVGAHPHRGFETVTVVYQGELEHRDSTGAGGKIGPGDVQWMTAAGGIVHEEFHASEFTRTGGTLEMVQLWVNLPAKHKRAKAGYQTLLNAQIPGMALSNYAGHVRVIAGEFNGQTGPARTFTPVNVWDARLNAARSAELPVPDGHTTAFLVLRGRVLVNGEEEAVEGDLPIFARGGDRIGIEAKTDATLLVLTGEPIAEPVVGYGPFVMNSRAEIEQAYEDFQHGRMGQSLD